jgi:hypothetical protein
LRRDVFTPLTSAQSRKETTMATKIFANLPVKDLSKSIAFFRALGYTFNPQFTKSSTR